MFLGIFSTHFTKNLSNLLSLILTISPGSLVYSYFKMYINFNEFVLTMEIKGGNVSMAANRYKIIKLLTNIRMVLEIDENNPSYDPALRYIKEKIPTDQEEKN